MKKNALLNAAVHNSKPISRQGALERLFTLMFKGFVYPQIWEDPEVDLKALNLTGDSRIVTIASGGCNALNYLTEGPARIDAVDLNPAHVALSRLKLAALKHFPDHETYFRFFGHADERGNIRAFNTYLLPHLDAPTRKFWTGWTPVHGRRINYFAKNIYKFGLLGRFIGSVHAIARLHGMNPRVLLAVRTPEEQKAMFDATISPLFEKKLVRAMCGMPVTLYGLGIPPAQFESLMVASRGDISGLLRDRLERLACDFPIEDNYFAWQAFGRGYDRHYRKAVPRYLRRENYDRLRELVDRVQVHHASMTDWLADQPADSMDGYVLLDAQDWMNADQLNALWAQIVRTAKPGARVIFRTAGEESPLTEKLTPDLLAGWGHDLEACRDLTRQDRASIYGGFHLYVREG
jgi:S-adenosylmethionine-diacylglycerol 3-amino-3-carboxypropyl transferase